MTPNKNNFFKRRLTFSLRFFIHRMLIQYFASIAIIELKKLAGGFFLGNCQYALPRLDIFAKTIFFIR